MDTTEDTLNILVVDNHRVFLEFAEELLAGEGHNVRTAESGLEAIDIMRDFIPELMFTDLVMPNINGHELSRYVRAMKELKEIYIVVVSGIAAESEGGCIPSEYANACIAKSPFGEMGRHMLQVVERYRRGGHRENAHPVLGLGGLAPRRIIQELLFDKKHYETLVNTISQGVIEITGERNRIVYINPRAAEISGLDPLEDLTRPISEAFADIDPEDLEAIFEESGERRRIGDGEMKKERRPPAYSLNDRLVETEVVDVHLGGYASRLVLLKDVTQFKENEAKLTRTIEDKEVLLREINHRVKNNLAMVASIIELEKEKMEESAPKFMLDDLLQRINSLSLLYDQLHVSADMKNVALEQYIPELVTNITRNLYTPQSGIDLSLDIESISLGTDTVIPLGIIITELVTNAIKYGFTESPRKPKLEIKVRATPEFRLEVANNGVPFPEDKDPKETEGMGLFLVYGLAGQIRCDVEMVREEGTRFIIREKLNN
ncbi:MAG: sensor histidine kinase [Spirochaetia bacterium]